MSDVAVLGAGAWGQALALHAVRAGHRVTLVARRPEAVLDLDGNSRRLPGIAWPDAVALAAVPPARCDLVLVATPVAGLRAALAACPDGDAPLVLCCKGMEAATALLPFEIAASVTPGRAIAVLTGPNFAHEIASGLPAASVVASARRQIAERIVDCLGNARLRLYPSDDPVGASVAGATKNVIAIAAGIAIGAGYGENSRAALVTRGLAETVRLARRLGGRAETVAGLAGAGDLLLTTTGARSRNFRAGLALGAGLSLGAGDGASPLLPRAPEDESDAAPREVAEGIVAAPSVVRRGVRSGVDMPIARAVDDLLAKRCDVAQAVENLMSRSPGPE